MPTIDLTDAELSAIDMACMTLQESVRRGRKKQAAYRHDGDVDGAEWTETGIGYAETARVTLRALLDRCKEDRHAND